MKQIKNLSIYLLVLAFIYIGAGVPLTSYCCAKNKEVKTSCCKKVNDPCKTDCCKTVILKVDNFEQASNSNSITPSFTWIAVTLPSVAYQLLPSQDILIKSNSSPPGISSSREYLNKYCVLVI